MRDTSSTTKGPIKVRLTPLQREQRYYDALRLIARDFQTSERLLRDGDCGLSGVESLEMAYDNIQEVAEIAIRGMRRPKEAQNEKEELKYEINPIIARACDPRRKAGQGTSL